MDKFSQYSSSRFAHGIMPTYVLKAHVKKPKIKIFCWKLYIQYYRNFKSYIFKTTFMF